MKPRKPKTAKPKKVVRRKTPARKPNGAIRKRKSSLDDFPEFPEIKMHFPGPRLVEARTVESTEFPTTVQVPEIDTSTAVWSVPDRIYLVPAAPSSGWERFKAGVKQLWQYTMTPFRR